MKKLVKHMPIEDGRFMVGIMQVGDEVEPSMYLEFSKHLRRNMLLYKINRMRRAGEKYSFNVAAYRQAGYEVGLLCYVTKSEKLNTVLLVI